MSAPKPTPASPDRARLAHAERLLDIARAALDEAIARAAARGDRAEVEALHRDRRLLGGG